MFSRLRVLLTGNVEWVDIETGETERDHYGWRDRWSIFGVHSYNWGWVRRLGVMDCGCTRNPLTRRMVLFRFGCAEHCALDASDAALLNDQLHRKDGS